MDLHSLQPAEGSTHRKIRVGRGRASGKGKTAGRGHKGQMSRAGASHKPLFEGGQMPFVRKLPKRGFKNFTRVEMIPVNLDALNVFEDGTEVTIELLKEKGLVNGRFDGVKILGNGSVEKKLTIKANAFSASAKEKIEAAGGSCEIV
ncbi:50S ribosomal protein L15 [Pontiella sp.]|uniref:50S ribosomal protein L15 n=1 Tax=Pontiella sp. TaxID=2837462 RepID=UPI003561E3E4